MNKYQVDLPYPPTKISYECREYGLMLLDNIGSCISEVGAINLYTYNSIITDANLKEVADTFHEVSIVEMHHLDMLSELCLLEGVEPRWWSCHQGQFQYWSPDFLHYSRDLRVLLQNAIQDEQSAIKQYQHQASIIQDPCIVRILERIILDEQYHIQLFHELFCKYCK